MKPRDFLALCTLAALWGASFLFIRVAAPAVGPIGLAQARVALASVALLVYVALLRRNIEFRRRWKSYLILGVLNAALPYMLISTAELNLTAGIAAILNATTPLFGALVAAIWIGESLTARKLTGLLVGLTGVAVLVGWSPLRLTPIIALSVLASLLAAVLYGVAGVYAKRALKGASPLGSAAGQQIGATLALLPIGLPLLARTAQYDLTPGVIWAVLTLAIGCTAIAYLLYFYLIRSVGPTSTLSVTFLVPFFGLFWSALFLHEEITGGTIAALAIIVVSVLLVTETKLPAFAITAFRRTTAIALNREGQKR